MDTLTLNRGEQLQTSLDSVQLYHDKYELFRGNINHLLTDKNMAGLAFIQWVAGSSPARLINLINKLQEATSLLFLFVYAFMYAFNFSQTAMISCLFLSCDIL
jgi:hypothetical protein